MNAAAFCDPLNCDEATGGIFQAGGNISRVRRTTASVSTAPPTPAGPLTKAATGHWVRTSFLVRPIGVLSILSAGSKQTRSLLNYSALLTYHPFLERERRYEAATSRDHRPLWTLLGYSFFNRWHHDVHLQVTLHSRKMCCCCLPACNELRS